MPAQPTSIALEWKRLANDYTESNNYVADRYDPRLMACMSMLSDVQELVRPEFESDENNLLNAVKLLLSDMADDQRYKKMDATVQGVKA